VAEEGGRGLDVFERELRQRFVTQPNPVPAGIQPRGDVLGQADIEVTRLARRGVNGPGFPSK